MTHFKHNTTYYVPCFQKDKIWIDSNGEYQSSSTFEYSLSEASQDEQMAWSFNPDYVFKLESDFDAITQPIDLSIYKHNRLIEIKDKK